MSVNLNHVHSLHISGYFYKYYNNSLYNILLWQNPIYYNSETLLVVFDLADFSDNQSHGYQ